MHRVLESVTGTALLGGTCEAESTCPSHQSLPDAFVLCCVKHPPLPKMYRHRGKGEPGGLSWKEVCSIVAVCLRKPRSGAVPEQRSLCSCVRPALVQLLVQLCSLQDGAAGW